MNSQALRQLCLLQSYRPRHIFYIIGTVFMFVITQSSSSFAWGNKGGIWLAGMVSMLIWGTTSTESYVELSQKPISTCLPGHGKLIFSIIMRHAVMVLLLFLSGAALVSLCTGDSIFEAVVAAIMCASLATMAFLLGAWRHPRNITSFNILQALIFAFACIPFPLWLTNRSDTVIVLINNNKSAIIGLSLGLSFLITRNMYTNRWSYACVRCDCTTYRDSGNLFTRITAIVFLDGLVASCVRCVRKSRPRTLARDCLAAFSTGCVAVSFFLWLFIVVLGFFVAARYLFRSWIIQGVSYYDLLAWPAYFLLFFLMLSGAAAQICVSVFKPMSIIYSRHRRFAVCCLQAVLLFGLSLFIAACVDLAVFSLFSGAVSRPPEHIFTHPLCMGFVVWPLVCTGRIQVLRKKIMGTIRHFFFTAIFMTVAVILMKTVESSVVLFTLTGFLTACSWTILLRVLYLWAFKEDIGAWSIQQTDV